jgi:hypothetical protein
MKLFSLLSIAALAGLLQAAPQPLFNGRDLTGWVVEGPQPSFEAKDGVLRVTGRGHVPNWLRTGREYDDFHLSLDYKLDEWAEAAVILRAARSEHPQHTGITIMLAHDFHHELTPWVTGAIQGAVSPKAELPASWEKWHHLDVDLRGTHLKATIDGTLVQDLDLDTVPALANRLRRGYIGFPDMGYGYELRNLQIEDLGRSQQFQELVPGDALTGWDKRGDSGVWMWDNGVLTGAYGHSILYAPPVVGNFELTAVVRSRGRVNAGIFLHGDVAGERRGFEIQIYSPVDAVYPTGSIYGRVRSRVQTDFEERWFLMQIRVEGARCRVWLDGELTAETGQLPPELQKPGRIGFQIHRDNALVEFRDIRLRVLN